MSMKKSNQSVFADPDGEVNSENKEIEIDLFCVKPLVIAECTTYVLPNKVAKVRRFVKTKEFIHKKYGEEPIAYFFTYGLEEEVREEVTKLLKDAHINLVCGQ